MKRIIKKIHEDVIKLKLKIVVIVVMLIIEIALLIGAVILVWKLILK